MQLPSHLKNRSIQFGLGIIVVVVLIAIFSGGKVDNEAILPSPTNSSLSQISDLNQEKAQRAADYRKQIISNLPIYLDLYRTTVGIETDISITALESDPPEIVYIQIGGLSYVNPETDPLKNPNVTAFKESYQEAMQQLIDRGIDPTKLIFVYSDIDYVARTTNIWLQSLNLSP